MVLLCAARLDRLVQVRDGKMCNVCVPFLIYDMARVNMTCEEGSAFTVLLVYRPALFCVPMA